MVKCGGWRGSVYISTGRVGRCHLNGVVVSRWRATTLLSGSAGSHVAARQHSEARTYLLTRCDAGIKARNDHRAQHRGA